MKDIVVLMLLIIMAILFAYYLLKKLNAIISETFRLQSTENAVKGCVIKIGTTRKSLFDSTKSALEQCSQLHPNIEYIFSISNVNHLLWKLYIGRIDIILLSEKHIKKINKGFSSFHVPYRINKKDKIQIRTEGEEENRCYVVWNPSITSRERDRVLFYIENDQNSIRSGYYECVE